MGNSNRTLQDSTLISNFHKEDWIHYTSNPSVELWRNRYSQQTVEVYRLYEIPSQEDMEIFEWRSKQDDLVKIFHVAVEQDENMCAKIQHVQLIVQHIAVKLYSINFLDVQEALTVLTAALRAFHLIQNRFGLVQPNEQLIGFNEHGQPKIWLNKSINLNYSEHNINSNSQNNKNPISIRVRKLYEIIEQRSRNHLLPTDGRQQFLKSHMNHLQALAFIQKFAQRNNLNLKKYLSTELLNSKDTFIECSLNKKKSYLKHRASFTSVDYSQVIKQQQTNRLNQSAIMGHEPQMKRIFSVGHINLKSNNEALITNTFQSNQKQKQKDKINNNPAIFPKNNCKIIPKISFIQNNIPIKVFDQPSLKRESSRNRPLQKMYSLNYAHPHPIQTLRILKPETPQNINSSSQKKVRVKSATIDCPISLVSNIIQKNVVASFHQQHKQQPSEIKSFQISPKLQKLQNKQIIVDQIVDEIQKCPSLHQNLDQHFRDDSYDSNDNNTIGSPCFAQDNTYHQFISFAPSQQIITSDKLLQNQGQTVTFKAVHLDKQETTPIQQVKQANMINQTQSVLSSIQQSELQILQREDLPKASIQVTRADSNVKIQSNTDYFGTSTMQVIKKKVSQTEQLEEERHERTSAFAKLQDQEIQKYIRQKYKAFIKANDVPNVPKITHTSTPPTYPVYSNHHLNVNRIESQYETLQIKQLDTYKISQPSKFKEIRPHRQSTQVNPNRRQSKEQDFLDVNFLEQSLDKKYQGSNRLTSAHKKPEEEDALNIAMLEEGLLKFSKTQTNQFSEHSHKNQQKQNFTQNSIEQSNNEVSFRVNDNETRKQYKQTLNEYDPSSRNVWDNTKKLQGAFMKKDKKPSYAESKYNKKYQQQYPQYAPTNSSRAYQNQYEYLGQYISSSKDANIKSIPSSKLSKLSRIQRRFDNQIATPQQFKPNTSFSYNNYDEDQSFGQTNIAGTSLMKQSQNYKKARISYDQLISILKT